MIKLEQKGNTLIILKLKIMESYLIDEKILDDITDTLIKEKYPNESIENHQDIKKDVIKSLDYKITEAIFGKLTEEQSAELSELLDNNIEDPSKFEEFFQRHSIDIQATITDVMIDFKNEFLKGEQNA